MNTKGFEDEIIEAVALGVHNTAPMGKWDDEEYRKDCRFEAVKILSALRDAGFVVTKEDR